MGKQKKSYKENALILFKSRIGEVVTSRELASLEGRNGVISHNIRRVFELRDEDGYDLVNHRDNDRTGLNLKVDEWVLLNPDPDLEKVKARGVNKRIRMAVFTRDNYTCQTCGRTPQDNDPFDPAKKVVLHLGHKVAHKRKEINDFFKKELNEDDFITMCSVCNEGAKNNDVNVMTLLDRVKISDKETKLEIKDYLESINL